MTSTSTQAPGSGVTVERNGVNVIAEAERRGRPRDLFWPWFAGNISVLAVSYGSFVLGFGISFAQAVLVAILGIVLSNLLVGVISLAGKRGSAPTMTLSRSIFGVRGNRVPAAISWLLTAGWETALAALAVLAIGTVFTRLGFGGGPVTKVIALIIVIGLIALGGTLGFTVIMRMQVWITVIVGVLTVVYIVFAAPHIAPSSIAALPAGNAQAVIGALLFTMTGFGLGWVNAAADYSRYLPRSVSSRGVVAWSTLGASLPPVVLLVFGLALAGSSKGLSSAIGADPIGALTEVLPTWLLIPFAVTAVLGLIGGAVMDIYSSGLSLLNAGLRVPRVVAVGIDSVIMTIGVIYVVFFAANFIGPFEGVLITLGVPIAAWAGIFLADITLRRRDYAEAELLSRYGRYGDVRWFPILLILIGTLLGWGLVTNTAAPWLAWQGYLLGPFGLGGTQGAWAYANLGVFVALAVGYVGMLIGGRRSIRRQEELPAAAEVPLTDADVA
ncbi:cytosine permease [Amnibacterium sp.]|uniref:purine-cytosine permease family protein n=1 Tax=Amnibacterium sp. TaxID=1872496 RepID=UPI00260B17DF|nr:cytosine permease [Amnibacterium sp.]MCU1473027.1 Purine-cytosine permease-like transporter [Amnibacterium sp.]